MFMQLTASRETGSVSRGFPFAMLAADVEDAPVVLEIFGHSKG